MDEMIYKLAEIVSDSRYKIPLYQRNFSWTSDQIETLLRDIYDCFCSGKDKYFIGSLVVKPISSNQYEVIDGQQRLTVISLITSILFSDIRLDISYVSRKEVSDFYEVLYKDGFERALQLPDQNQIKSFHDAIIAIQKCENEDDNNDHGPIIYKEHNGVEFKDYFLNNVYLVREIMPSETDVAKYFEIMNNRGKQLQHHEILKAMFMSGFEGDLDSQYVFAEVWDNCSQMDRRIQKTFKGQRRKEIFGYNKNKEFGELYLDNIYTRTVATDAFEYSLSDIITGNYPKNEQNNVEITEQDDDEKIRNDKENSIIDFPNFLMHVLRVFYNDSYSRIEQKDIPLNEKYLLDVYGILHSHGCFNSPETIRQFSKQLLLLRVLFDRYIIKVTENENDEEDVRWTLRRPIEASYSEDTKRRLYFTPTYNENDIHYEQIKMSLEMLQVTFRSRIYKTYLSYLLTWLSNIALKTSSIEVQASEYLFTIHGFMIKYFRDRCLDEEVEKPLGENMSHMLLNFIDYLYWVSAKRRIKFGDANLDQEIAKVSTQFDYKYWNSVEHHYPRQRRIDFPEEGVTMDEVNSVGNLFLISKSSNSSLGKMNPKDKANSFIGVKLPPSRTIVYEISRNGTWSKAEINAHKNSVLKLLSNSSIILNL